MCNAAITARCEEEHLILERISRKRPAMAEDYRLPGPPAIVVDLRAILCGDRCHVTTPSLIKRKDYPAKRKGTFGEASLFYHHEKKPHSQATETRSRARTTTQ